MYRRRWVVAVVTASVVVVGAGAAIAMVGGDAPRDVSRDDPRDDDFVFMDDLSPDEQVASRRIEVENLMIQGGEPYTQEDVDRELAELLETEREFPQEMREEGEPVEDTGDDEIVNTIVSEGDQ